MTTTKIRLTTQVKGTTALSIPYTASDGAIGEVALGTSDQVLLGGTASPEFAQLSHLVLADIGTKTHAQIDNLVGGGTSFPISPTVGDRYFRSDLGLDCYYHSDNQWLTVGTFSISRELTAASGDASDAGDMENSILSIGYKPFITRIDSAYTVDNVNNACDHYEISHGLTNDPYTGATYTSLLAHSTTSDAANTLIYRSDAVNKAATGADFHYLSTVVWTDKTPGSFWLEEVTYYKLIIT